MLLYLFAPFSFNSASVMIYKYYISISFLFFSLSLRYYLPRYLYNLIIRENFEIDESSNLCLGVVRENSSSNFLSMHYHNCAFNLFLVMLLTMKTKTSVVTLLMIYVQHISDSKYIIGTGAKYVDCDNPFILLLQNRSPNQVLCLDQESLISGIHEERF